MTGGTERRRKNEGGFALLLVFMMTAAIALALYQQLPRVAFESQRDKEDLLIDRGEQYKRAIRLYYMQFKKYPSKIEDLENTNNQRFLRHRFIDPMTGSNEWRLIHANAGGALTDSKVVPPPDPNAPANAANTGPLGTPGSTPNQPGSNPPNGLGTFGSNTGAPNQGAPNQGFNPANPNDPNAQPVAINPMVARRPSDNVVTPPIGAPAFNNPYQPGGNYNPNDPQYYPPITLTPATQGGQPGQPQPGQPGYVQQSMPPQFQGQQFPGQPYQGQFSPTAQGVPGGQLNPQFNPQQIPQPAQQLAGQVIGQQLIGQANPGQPVTSQPLPGQPGFDPQSGGYGVDGTWIPNQPGNQPGNQGVPAFMQQVPGGTNPPNGYPPITLQTGNGQPGQGQPGALQPGTGQPGPPGAPGNGALTTINNALRTPQQTQPSTSSAFSNDLGSTNTILVGVATKFEGPSIKIYKDHQKYNFWEFIFDPKEYLQKLLPPPSAQGSGLNGQPGQNGPLSSPSPTSPNPSGAGTFNIGIGTTNQSTPTQ